MTAQRRLASLAGLFLLGLSAVGLRIFHLQVLRGGDYAEQAERSRLRIEWTEAQRGSLLDRNGQWMARDRIAYDLDLVLSDFSLAGDQNTLVSNLEAAFRVAGPGRKREEIRDAIESAIGRVEDLADRAARKPARMSGPAPADRKIGSWKENPSPSCGTWRVRPRSSSRPIGPVLGGGPSPVLREVSGDVVGPDRRGHGPLIRGRRAVEAARLVPPYAVEGLRPATS